METSILHDHSKLVSLRERFTSGRQILYMVAPFLKEQWSNKLHVVTMISNPYRFSRRYDLYMDFAKHMEDSGVVLWTAELQQGERSFCITSPDNPQHLQLRTTAILWHKENCLNLMMHRLPLDAQYIAWLDADVHFIRNDWAEEAIHVLQIHPWIQLWSECTDLNVHNEICKTYKSFCWCWHNDRDAIEHSISYGTKPKGFRYPHPGFAWAARREALYDVGSLFDYGIVGSGDFVMARALIGKANGTFPLLASKEYKHSIRVWEERAVHYLKHDIGYIDGLIISHHHGKKSNRRYLSRADILVNSQFNPYVDLKPDTQGLYILAEEHPRQFDLRDDLRHYFTERNEDDVCSD